MVRWGVEREWLLRRLLRVCWLRVGSMLLWCLPAIRVWGGERARRMLRVRMLLLMLRLWLGVVARLSLHVSVRVLVDGWHGRLLCLCSCVCVVASVRAHWLLVWRSRSRVVGRSDMLLVGLGLLLQRGCHGEDTLHSGRRGER